jgi:hypothetical protein
VDDLARCPDASRHADRAWLDSPLLFSVEVNGVLLNVARPDWLPKAEIVCAREGHGILTILGIVETPAVRRQRGPRSALVV